MHTSCIYLERLSFYLYMEPYIISKYITLMPSKRQRHTYISHTGNTRDVFYVRRKVDLMQTAKVKTYIMHIFGKIGLLSILAT